MAGDGSPGLRGLRFSKSSGGANPEVGPAFGARWNGAYGPGGRWPARNGTVVYHPGAPDGRLGLAGASTSSASTTGNLLGASAVRFPAEQWQLLPPALLATGTDDEEPQNQLE